MRTLLLVSLITYVLVGGVLAQSKSPPRFEDFPVTGNFSGKPVRVNLRSHPHARMFRTQLRETAKQSANLAGHYAIGRWGCGTECIRIGIVNLKTGQAYVSPFYASVGVVTRVDSRLLIVAPPEQIKEQYGDDAPEYLYPRYFVWRKNKLVLIYPESDKGYEADPFWK